MYLLNSLEAMCYSCAVAKDGQWGDDKLRYL